MPAATVNATVESEVFGRVPIEIVDVTWGNNDTYTAVNLGAIAWAEFVPTTNTAFGLTIATNVVTLVSGGSLTGKLICYGNAY